MTNDIYEINYPDILDALLYVFFVAYALKIFFKIITENYNFNCFMIDIANDLLKL